MDNKNLEQRIGVFDKIRNSFRRNIAAYLTLAALTSSAAYAGCGKEDSFCCEKAECSESHGTGYSCVELSILEKDEPDAYCINDPNNSALECCKCSYSPPTQPKNDRW